ncbi:OmpA family protein [Mangrovihabitans endophyticus]|uniref:OmpA-like domain-containing protein n=1 Tax=Mangrovihabitans endophyticus TaxID=1751298 RepID=A0A8J3BUJ8_9ACTN|nr:OmpA family protein [Mangrovihabitans endophyticus]GGK79220.1 hypothetical protein GCM10012284_11540 [Mangrovihabitans endophyticus]
MNPARHAAVPFLLTVTLAAGGCSAESWFGASEPADRCPTLLTEPPGNADPASVTVLLADGSASAFDRPEPAMRDDWDAKLAAHLPGNGADLVAMGRFGGAIDWQPPKLTPAKSSDANRTKNDFKAARRCLTDDLAEMMTVAPSKPQSDVLRALAEGTEYVRKWAGPKSIYLATDGLANTGCADLRAAPMGDRTAIKDIVAGCGPELPKLDASYTVHFIGVGNAASGWPDIKTPQRTWIADLWKALCDATKATCEEPDSAKPTPVDASGAKPPADNEVRMPALEIKKDNPVVVSVPSSLLFDTDSYELAPDRSQESLQQVYDFLKTLRPKRIEVNGHTDSRGTPEHNHRLSKNRADAVASRLRAQNFTGITTNGYASDRAKCTPEYRDGAPDLIAMACNRRVEIVVYV